MDVVDCMENYTMNACMIVGKLSHFIFIHYKGVKKYNNKYECTVLYYIDTFRYVAKYGNIGRMNTKHKTLRKK